MDEQVAPEIRSLDDLKKEFEKVFLMEDKGVIGLICACIIANQIDIDPVWLLLISPPSGGKTELIEALELVTLRGKPLAFPISDLTVNTFASGQKKTGKETSLLHKMAPGSIMTFKDFTSMISKNKDAQQEIMGQLREIYDQHYVKRTGTGEDIAWRGKVGAVAGCTQVIYESNEQFSVMGDRFIMYEMLQPDRMEVLERVVDAMSDRENKFKDKKTYLKRCMKSYLEYCFDNIESVPLDLDLATRKSILEVVNFVTTVASGVMVDKKKGTVEFVPSPTMPMRMAKQILGLAQAFVLMNKLEPVHEADKPEFRSALRHEQVQTLFKVAFDTIPIKRRMALKILTRFELGATSAGIATSLGYQTPVVSSWLAQLNALGIVTREKRGGGSDKWFLRQKYREIMVEFEKIETVKETLEGDPDEEDYNATWNTGSSATAVLPLDSEVAATQESIDKFYEGI